MSDMIMVNDPRLEMILEQSLKDARRIAELEAALREIESLELPDGSIYDAPKIASAALEKQ